MVPAMWLELYLRHLLGAHMRGGWRDEKREDIFTQSKKTIWLFSHLTSIIHYFKNQEPLFMLGTKTSR